MAEIRIKADPESWAEVAAMLRDALTPIRDAGQPATEPLVINTPLGGDRMAYISEHGQLILLPTGQVPAVNWRKLYVEKKA